MDKARQNLTPTAGLLGHVIRDTFRIDEKASMGGMGWVYRGTHIQLHGDVAIKILSKKYSNSSSYKNRFLEEARVSHQLSHPNIVKVLDLIEEPGLVGFVMEWCAHGTLKQWLDKLERPASVWELKTIFLPLLNAMSYAHAHGVVHCDLKPQNILMHQYNSEWSPKISDFGISRQLHISTAPRKEIVGTLQYMAPELFDEADPDHRSDIYSLGVILYQMICGKPPFEGSVPSLMYKIMEEDPELPDDVPEMMREIIECALKKEPDQRFSSVRAFHKAFSYTLENSSPLLNQRARLNSSGQNTNPFLTPFPSRSYNSLDELVNDLESTSASRDVEEIAATNLWWDGTVGEKNSRWSIHSFIRYLTLTMALLTVLLLYANFVHWGDVEQKVIKLSRVYQSSLSTLLTDQLSTASHQLKVLQADNFNKHAKQVLRSSSFIFNIHLIDAKYRVVHGLSRKATAPQQEFVSVAAYRLALQQASHKKRTILSKPFLWGQTLTYALVVPSEQDSWRSALFSMEAVMNLPVYQKQNRALTSQLLDGDLQVFRTQGFSAQLNRLPKLKQVQTLSVLQRKLKLVSLPAPALCEKGWSFWTTFWLGLGGMVGITLLIFAMLYFLPEPELEQLEGEE